MENRIETVDQTIREGMQHRGIVFSRRQRLEIVRYQDQLGVTVSQAGYPPAHDAEAAHIAYLNRFCRESGFRIRIAGMGRAILRDAEILVNTGINDFHLHLHIKKGADRDIVEAAMADVSESVGFIRRKCPAAVISIAVLDIFRTDRKMLEKVAVFLSETVNVDIISLPDTSGVAAPGTVAGITAPLAEIARRHGTRISIHCHNDMGMASANAYMGIEEGGARVLEASVAGVGERNGISDLFVTGKMLKDRGMPIDLHTENLPLFRAYYDYVNSIYTQQTGDNLVGYNTPVFGEGVTTHVAGTHAGGDFGQAGTERFCLNVLCGRRLVKKYLASRDIPCNEGDIDRVTQTIKNESARKERRLYQGEIEKIVKKSLQK